MPRTMCKELLKIFLEENSVTCTVKKCFLMFQWSLLCSSFCPLPLVLRLGTTEKSQATSVLHPPFRMKSCEVKKEGNPGQQEIQNDVRKHLSVQRKMYHSLFSTRICSSTVQGAVVAEDCLDELVFRWISSLTKLFMTS